MPIKRMSALWRRLTNAGRLLIFVPACFGLLCCWGLSMLALALFYVGEGWIKRTLDKLDRFLVKGIE